MVKAYDDHDENFLMNSASC